MIINETYIKGVFIIEQKPFSDERGNFARAFCKKELEEYGLCSDFVQSNISLNHKRGTLRGIHAQRDEFAEDKLVFCPCGALYDVCIDIRKNSPTYGQYVGIELTEDNGKMLYIPKGCAHAYLTLRDNTRAFYFVTQFYAPGSEIGFMYDEPVFCINWPIKENLIISDKDRSWEYIK